MTTARKVTAARKVVARSLSPRSARTVGSTATTMVWSPTYIRKTPLPLVWRSNSR
jgi:hypothetical protein